MSQAPKQNDTKMNIKEVKLKLRQVRKEDCRLLWGWVNDAAVRLNSFNSNLVQWDEHQRWFEQKLTDSNCFIYIILGEYGAPVGQVRFEIGAGGIAEIGISIDVLARRKGYASAALGLSCRRVSRESNISKVIAHIKQDNKASTGAFISAGFIDNGLHIFKGFKVIEMIWLNNKLELDGDSRHD